MPNTLLKNNYFHLSEDVLSLHASHSLYPQSSSSGLFLPPWPLTCVPSFSKEEVWHQSPSWLTRRVRCLQWAESFSLAQGRVASTGLSPPSQLMCPLFLQQPVSKTCEKKEAAKHNIVNKNTTETHHVDTYIYVTFNNYVTLLAQI